MPNDLYKWEVGGGLRHHCQFCDTPLSNPEAKHQCVGKHMDPCKRYHCELFPKGQSDGCKYCIGIDEERYKRHRQVAQLIHELKQAKEIGQSQIKLSYSASKTTNATPGNYTMPEDEIPMRKKERKAAKRAAKLTSMRQHYLTAADVDFVARVLHPDASEAEDDANLERKLLEDTDIKLNRPFHRGTSNRREVRNVFVKRDKQRANKNNHQIDPAELDGLLQLLDVSPLTSSSSAAEKDIYAKLKMSIENAMLQAQKEAEMTMMRKAGFWRWVSKKAYNRLVASGRIWGRKGSPAPSTTTTASSSSASVGADEGETDESTEPDTDVTTPSEEEDYTEAVTEDLTIYAEVASPIVQTPKTQDQRGKQVDTDDGWTTVGKPSKVKQPVGNIKLVHNGGLAKMDLPVTPLGGRRGFATSYEHLY